ncbi:hypothetical protein DFH08DRAFT_1087674 [Mycena albidolilacea]|uniref:Uncharacterized protein n=1 Tax=Mycena albidolilacea TaxID=1033008 RepID=A0AAD7EDA9_9AGAR|nr:hypothetical protein DFH08DRAFT_1087674 [Mycena albidolilacea]
MARVKHVSFSRLSSRPLDFVPLALDRFSKHRRTVGIYLADGVFVLANWLFLDACILSAHAKAPWGQSDTPAPVDVTVVDWLPGLCSLLGFLVNLIDKDRVRGDADTFCNARAVRRARLFLFIGLRHGL